MDYSVSYQTTANPALGPFMAVYGAVMLIVGILILVCMWKIFVKAGYEGWKSLIPGYNLYCLFEMTFGNGWLFFLCFVPCVGFIAFLVMYYKLALAFGKGAGFAAGLIFLSFIFIPILAFGNAEYQGI